MVTVISIVVDTLGIVPKGLKKKQKELEIRRRIETNTTSILILIVFVFYAINRIPIFLLCCQFGLKLFS